jgi:hypothetical protein
MTLVTDTCTPTAVAGPFVGSRFLASGLLVEVDPQTRRATPVTCDWLVEVPNGNPEPDEPSDCYDILPCGARVRRHPVHPEGTLCEGGHDRLPNHIEFAPFGPAWEREQADRFAETGSYA